MKSRLISLPVALLCALLPVVSHATDRSADPAPRRRALLDELCALQVLIDAPSESSEFRAHCAARRDSALKELGSVEVELAKTDDPVTSVILADSNPKPASASPGSADTGDAKPAGDAVYQFAKKAMDEAEKLKVNFTRHQAYFHIGVNLLNPYSIVPVQEPDGTGKLVDSKTRRQVTADGGTKTGSYLEFVYSNRWAWNETKINQTLMHATDRAVWSKQLYYAGEAKPAEGRTDGLKALAVAGREGDTTEERRSLSVFRGDWRMLGMTDVQVRLGYNFAKGGEVSANTLVGSSDIGAELDLGVPFYARDFKYGAFTVGPEFSYSATTERTDMDVHHREFAGIGYTTSFVSPYSSEGDRRILVHMRLGGAYVENVRYLDDTTQEIVTTHGGTPRYFSENAFAFETEMLFPVRTSSFLTVGARLYGVPKTGPNPWTVYVGMTVPISSVVDGVTPK